MRNEQETENKVEKLQQKEGGSKKLLFALSIIVLGMLAYIVYIQIIGPFISKMNVIASESKQNATANKAKQNKAKKISPTNVEMYQFQQLTTNPAGSAGRRFVLISLAAVLDPTKKRKLLKELENKNPQLKDVLIEILSSKTIEYLETKKEELRKEILLKLNEKLVTGKLKEIYFTEFVIQ